MIRFITVAAAALMLSACSTVIVPTQEISTAVRADLKVADVKATVANGIDAPADVNTRLEQAVQKAMATKNPNGKTVAKVNISVTRYVVVSGATRAVAGALAGSNKLYATVDVIDAQSGATIGKFDVQRDSNPGGFGMFVDQDQVTIEAAADGVAEGIYGPSVK